MSPLITGEIVASPIPDWVRFLVFPGGILMVVGVVSLFMRASDDHDLSVNGEDMLTVVGVFSLAFGAFALGLAGWGAFGPEEYDQRKVNPDVLVETIVQDYRLDAIDIHDDLEIDVEALCAPVSTDSPEVIGTARGQQISFRVGVADCDAEKPEARIIITETPGQALDPDSLRKDRP